VFFGVVGHNKKQGTIFFRDHTFAVIFLSVLFVYQVMEPSSTPAAGTRRRPELPGEIFVFNMRAQVGNILVRNCIGNGKTV
jgi:hypothetical protein